MTIFKIWWISGDKQSSMDGGDYPSREAAEVAIPAVEDEFRSQRNEDSPYDEDSYWQIEEICNHDDALPL
jgi:hypothetical protein